MRNFKDVTMMAEKYNRHRSLHIGKEELLSLDDFQFRAFIYNLDTGRFGITGFSDKGLITYFMTSGNNEKDNWAMDVINNLPYGVEEFVKVLNRMNHDKNKKDRAPKS